MLSNRAVKIFNDIAMSHIRKIIKHRQRQQALDKFLAKEEKEKNHKKESTEERRKRRKETPNMSRQKSRERE